MSQAIGEPDVQLETMKPWKSLARNRLPSKLTSRSCRRLSCKDYKGIEASRRVRPVTDANVD